MVDFLDAIDQRTKAEARLAGLMQAVKDAEEEITKYQAIVQKASEQVDKTWTEGAKGAHRLDALRKAQAKLTEAIGWHQQLEGQIKEAKNGVALAKELLPQILRKAVKEKVEKLNAKMEEALDGITAVVAEADKIYLDFAKKYNVLLPPQDREALMPMPTRAKDEWLGWITPITRGLQALAAKRRAGEN
jgi:predicted  nucleic acid-binding Zn-ribbon protein